MSFQTDSKNGLYVPSETGDSLRLGVSTHKGSHDHYDFFVRNRDVEIITRGGDVEAGEKTRLIALGNSEFEADFRAKQIAAKFMAKEKQGLKTFLDLAIQEGGIPEADLRRGETLLAFNDVDPRCNGNGWAEKKNQAASADWKMDRIAGELDATRPGSYQGDQPGTEAFRAGVENRPIPYDRLAVVTVVPGRAISPPTPPIPSPNSEYPCGTT